jgi:hypothetical protein
VKEKKAVIMKCGSELAEREQGMENRDGKGLMIMWWGCRHWYLKWERSWNGCRRRRRGSRGRERVECDESNCARVTVDENDVGGSTHRVMKV